MKRVETKETYMCDICRKELSLTEYENVSKMTVTIKIPSKIGHCPGYTGVDNIDVCEECITGFGFVYDDPYVGDHQRRTNTLRKTYSDIINKVKLKLKFDKMK